MTLSRNMFFGILAGIAIVLILAIGITWRVAKKEAASPAALNANNSIQTPASPTRLDVPVNVTVPGVSSTVDANVAKPQTVVPQAGGFNYRSFNIQVNADKFTPDTIIVHAADDVYISFMAIDKNYDFKQPDNGFFGVLPKGQTKVLHGQFPMTGKFILYCESCGGPSKGPVMYVEVVPKTSP